MRRDNVERLKEFAKGRPIDRDKDLIDAFIEYVEKVENKSIERAKKGVGSYLGDSDREL